MEDLPRDLKDFVVRRTVFIRKFMDSLYYKRMLHCIIGPIGQKNQPHLLQMLPEWV